MKDEKKAGVSKREAAPPSQGKDKPASSAFFRPPKTAREFFTLGCQQYNNASPPNNFNILGLEQAKANLRQALELIGFTLVPADKILSQECNKWLSKCDEDLDAAKNQMLHITTPS